MRGKKVGEALTGETMWFRKLTNIRSWTIHINESWQQKKTTSFENSRGPTMDMYIKICSQTLRKTGAHWIDCFWGEQLELYLPVCESSPEVSYFEMFLFSYARVVILLCSGEMSFRLIVINRGSYFSWKWRRRAPRGLKTTQSQGNLPGLRGDLSVEVNRFDQWHTEECQ